MSSSIEQAVEACKRRSYELAKQHPELPHTKLLDLAAQGMGFAHYTALRTAQPLKAVPPKVTIHHLSDPVIAAAVDKAFALGLTGKGRNHEHPDCVRMCFEWIDAQTRTQNIVRGARPFKHMVEYWCGRYVSQSDFAVAAMLHSDIRGVYPYFNLSHRLVEPNVSRLANIGQAFAHGHKTGYAESPYRRKE